MDGGWHLLQMPHGGSTLGGSAPVFDLKRLQVLLLAAPAYLQRWKRRAPPDYTLTGAIMRQIQNCTKLYKNREKDLINIDETNKHTVALGHMLPHWYKQKLYKCTSYTKKILTTRLTNNYNQTSQLQSIKLGQLQLLHCKVNYNTLYDIQLN